MKRRRFLQTSAAGALAFSSGMSASNVYAQRRSARKKQAVAAAVENPVLVVIYLRGGQDQLNTIVPYSDKKYYEIRPTVAVPREKVLTLNNDWGFHPAIAPLKRHYDQGKVAVVINSGSPHPTRSHFDAQDFMEYAAPGNRTIRNGWLNRYLEATRTGDEKQYDPNNLRAVAMQELLPRSLRGDYPVVAVPPNLAEMNEVLDLFEDFYSGSRPGNVADAVAGINADPVMASGQQTVQGLRRLRELLHGDERTFGSRVDDVGKVFQEYPGTWFASRLQAIAKLIKSDVGLQIVGTDINGWDHHIGLGSTDGTLNRMLGFFCEGLAAFMDDLGPDLNRTLILVCTEFGRVCKENGNDGTDHGHGGPMWLLGGKVNGGKIYGDWRGLEERDLNDKRDLPVTTDFRDVFAEVLTHHMGFAPPADFFPNFKPAEAPTGLFG